MQPTVVNLSARNFIPTLLERKEQGVLVLAYCPICDKVEQATDDERGENRAMASSVAKIRAHMRMRHRITAA